MQKPLFLLKLYSFSLFLSVLISFRFPPIIFVKYILNMTVSVLLDFYCMKKKPAAIQPAGASPFRPGDTLYNNRGKLAGQISSLIEAFPVRRSICPVDSYIIVL